jgi:hypothetical protein
MEKTGDIFHIKAEPRKNIITVGALSTAINQAGTILSHVIGIPQWVSFTSALLAIEQRYPVFRKHPKVQ